MTTETFRSPVIATHGSIDPTAPLAEGGGYAWFTNRGIGRPLADSLRSTMD